MPDFIISKFGSKYALVGNRVNFANGTTKFLSQLSNSQLESLNLVMNIHTTGKPLLANVSNLLDANGSFTMQYDNLTPPTISSSANNVLKNTSVTFTASETGGTGNFVWQWYKNGNIVSGVTSNTYTRNVMANAVFQVSVNDIGLYPNAQANAISTIYSINVFKCLPPGVNYCIPINITNSQNSVIYNSNAFQQMLVVNSLKYSVNETNNLQNIEFSYANGTIIPSWLEGSHNLTVQANSLSNSIGTVYWLRLNKTPKYGVNALIYMGFAQKSNNLFNGNTIGESPLLRSLYAQYDNGNKVFNFYDSFVGNTLGASWNGIGNATVTVNNGLTLQSYASGWSGIQNNYLPPHPSIIEFYGNVQSNAYGAIGEGPYGLTYQSLGNQWEARYPDSTPDWGIELSHGANNNYGGAMSSGTNYLVSAYVITNTVLYTNYSSLQVASTSALDNSTGGIGLVATSSNTLNSNFFVQWTRARAYPPNGIMPTVTFGN